MVDEGKVKGLKKPKRYTRSPDVEHFAVAACPLIGVLLILASSHRQNYKPLNKIKMTRKKKSIKDDGKANKVTRMGFRATEKERLLIFQKSSECGISQSEYIRERALNHRPKARLTEREIEAYISLANARADLVHIKNALSGKSQEELLRYFREPHYLH